MLVDIFEKINIYENLDLDQSVENYLSHLKGMKYFSESMDAKFINFVQPFAFYQRKYKSKFEEKCISHLKLRVTKNGENEFSLLIKFYEKLSKKIKNDKNTKNLSKIFLDYQSEIYFDQVHLSDKGYDIIAKVIARDIENLEKS